MSCRRRRSANVTMYFLLFMGLTVPTMFMTINVWRIAEGKVQQQRWCDVASHAATCELTRETEPLDPPNSYSMLLYGDPTDIEDLCQTFCIDEAKKYAGQTGFAIPNVVGNYVDGVELLLDTTTVNKDVKFGRFDFSAATPTFTLIDPTAANVDIVEKRGINAVRVEGFRTIARDNSVRMFGPAWTGFTDAQIVTRTTAALDQRVIGFRIQNNILGTPLVYSTIPLAPVALQSEATVPASAAVNMQSWVYQVEKDADPANPVPAKIDYGTMTVTIPRGVSGDYTNLGTVMPAPNSQLLDIGIGAAAYGTFNTQLTGGITSAQMAVYNPAASSIILDSMSFTVDAPSFTAPVTSGMPGSDFQNLYDTFVALKDANSERAWALTNTINIDNPTVVVSGFVAARITEVNIVTDSEGADVIQLVLQPTLLETPTAFTDYSNVFLKGTSDYTAYPRIVNPYLCRVRLVD